MTIHFFVPGTAKPAGSKSAFPYAKASGSLGVRVADQSGKPGKEWRRIVQIYAKQAFLGKPLIPHNYPLRVEMIFYRPRPQSHFTASGAIKPSAPRYPTSRPDVLKLARAVEDALTGVIYEDDSSIVNEVLRKEWASINTGHGAAGVLVQIDY